MEYLTEESIINEGKQRILCCECGIVIEPNPANMCVGCLRTNVDITRDIPKQATLHFCKGCERYLQPPSDWIKCPLESRELLSLCLKRLKGLSKVKLIDAGFVWTEPHSKRIKVKLTVQGEVMGGAVLQQVFVVEYTVNGQMCDSCHRTEAQDYWRALVQVRQKCENKKTFYLLEQLILKYKAHENTLGIKPIHEGLDFFYKNESHARKMIEFINSVLPIRYQHSKRLLSHDIHSNIYNYKFTFSVEIVPVSKDSIICLPKKLTHQLGGIASICLVKRVSNVIHIIDPCTAQIAEISSQVYYRTPFNAICNPKQLTKYIIMDIEPLQERVSFPGQGHISSKHVMADAWVCKENDLGNDDANKHVRTHLGHILKPGDTVFGYNLEDSNINDENFDKLDRSYVPDVILVKKYYGSRSARRRYRNWKLRHLGDEDEKYIEIQTETDNDDYNDFLEDLEEDPTLRQHVNIFKSNKNAASNIAVDTDDETLDPNRPQVTLQEMLEDLHLDVEMNESN